jgi:hypothetical protein
MSETQLSHRCCENMLECISFYTEKVQVTDHHKYVYFANNITNMFTEVHDTNHEIRAITLFYF